MFGNGTRRDEWVLSNVRVATRSTVLENGWIGIRGGKVHEVNAGSPASWGCNSGDVIVDGGGLLALPGYIDVHVHGGAGAAFIEGRDSALEASSFHLRNGTTSLIAGLSTAPWRSMRGAVSELSELVSAVGAGSQFPYAGAGTAAVSSRIIGIFCEGPFISAEKRGAHDRELLVLPTERAIARIAEWNWRGVTIVTIAPELIGAREAIGLLVDRGMKISIGHTDADGRQLLDGVSAGATCLTHVFNAMREIEHRDGSVLDPLLHSDVPVELICDGIHVDTRVVEMLRALVGSERIILVTDASPWAGQPDGEYSAVGRSVTVQDGAVRLKGTGGLAGSALTMAAAVRNYAHFTGASLTELVRVSSANAARRVGLDDVLGDIAPGYVADMVLLDDDLSVVDVVREGRLLGIRRDVADGEGGTGAHVSTPGRP